MQKRQSVKNNEQGFASLVIALILIIVLSLLTVGFARLARNEQQNALDKQLATQANDAAETGINDAYKDITDGNITTANASPTTCMTTSTGLPATAATANPSIDPAHGVGYTCLLVDLTPPNIEYNLSPGSSQSLSFTTSDTTSSFTVTWGTASGNRTAPWGIAQKFLTYPAWNDASHNYPAVIEISITPLGDMTRSTLLNNDFTAYLYPTLSGSGTYDISSGNGPIVAAKCTNPGSQPCSATINGFNDTNFVVHVVDYYDNSNITISGANSAGQAVNFQDGQAQVDVTGKARNVLKRLQVRLPITAKAQAPPYAVVGQNVCKREQTAPAPYSTDFVDPNGAVNNIWGHCYLQ